MKTNGEEIANMSGLEIEITKDTVKQEEGSIYVLHVTHGWVTLKLH